METHDDARRALLARLIDHAPLFPPASLSVPDALEQHERAAASECAFVLARLVWPASRLAELPPGHRGLSVVLDGPQPAGALAEAIEARFEEADLDSLGALAVETYVEVPLDGALEQRLDALRARGLRAKVRCGGAVTPSREELAGFVRACRSRSVPFKATAGLHHALPADGEHGLLNLLAATVFGDEEEALAEEDALAFSLDGRAFRWRHRSAAAPELARVREEALCSIGSCSFFEPVEELVALGALAG